MTENYRKTRLTFQYFFKTFLIVTFPLHVWGLLRIFWNLETISKRSNLWDGFGFIGYSLFFILLESIALTLIFWGVSLLLPKTWGEKRTLTLTGSVFTILVTASVLDMVFHENFRVFLSRKYLQGLKYAPTMTKFLIFENILIAVVLIVLLILKSKSAEKILSEIFERFTLLSYLYLFLDVAGIVIVIIRNLSSSL